MIQMLTIQGSYSTLVGILIPLVLFANLRIAALLLKPTVSNINFTHTLFTMPFQNTTPILHTFILGLILGFRIITAAPAHPKRASVIGKKLLEKRRLKSGEKENLEKGKVSEFGRVEVIVRLIEMNEENGAEKCNGDGIRSQVWYLVKDCSTM